MPKLLKQQSNPHPHLVQCRKALEKVLGLTRNHAAATARRLDDKQVDAVLAAGDDPAKVQKAVEAVHGPEPKPEEPKLESPKPSKK